MMRPYHEVLVAHQECDDLPTLVTISRAYGPDRTACYAHMSMFLYADKGPPKALLASIDVRPHLQGQGYGSELLAEVALIADLYGWEVWLSAQGHIGGSRETLVAWYRRHGWISSPDDPYTMARPARERQMLSSLD